MFVYPRMVTGMLGARWHFRKVRDEIIPFANAISGAHHLLLIMPLHGNPLYPVAPVITMLRKRLLEDQITVVVSHHSTEALEALSRRIEAEHRVATPIAGPDDIALVDIDRITARRLS